MNLNDFNAVINQHGGLSKATHYFVTVTPPPSVPGVATRDLSFFCSHAGLPGLSFATTDVRHYNYGAAERRPYAPVFVDSGLTFLLDRRGDVLRFFHQWMQSVIDFDISRGIAGGAINGAHPYEVHYPDEYTTTVEIAHFDQAGEDIVVYELQGAYPITLNEVEMGWDLTDQIAQATIIFAYRGWKSTLIKGGSSASLADRASSSGVSGTAQVLGLSKDAGVRFGQALGLIRQPFIIADIINAVNNTKIY